MIKQDEFVAYIDYLSEIYPGLGIEFKESIDPDFNTMMFRSGLALGKTMKYLKAFDIKTNPLVLDSFLEVYRRDKKINKIIE